MARAKSRLFLIIACAGILAAGLVFSGCSTAPPVRKAPATGRSYRINGQWYHPITSSKGFRQTGLASWYGAPFHGRKTANGETYNMYARTAAHKVLPLGTHVLVKNLETGKSTVVRINDRGPFVRGRIIDLSYRAARDIGVVGPGTARVEIVALAEGLAREKEAASAPGDLTLGDFTVQVGAFVRRNLAERLRDELMQIHDQVTITQVTRDAKIFYRVRVGRFASLQSAEQIESRLIRSGFKNAFAVALDPK